MGASPPEHRGLAARCRQEQTCPFRGDGSNRPWALILPSQTTAGDRADSGASRPKPRRQAPKGSLGSAASCLSLSFSICQSWHRLRAQETDCGAVSVDRLRTVHASIYSLTVSACAIIGGHGTGDKLSALLLKVRVGRKTRETERATKRWMDPGLASS